MRIALYWTPDSSCYLARAAGDWLKTSSVSVAGVPGNQLEELLATPNHYGFHATVKPPFRLAQGWTLEDVEREMEIFCAQPGTSPFPLPRLQIDELDKFLCLRPSGTSRLLMDFAGKVVQRFDRFRKQAKPDEIARRRAAGLTPLQDALLLQWGYPYVLDEFRFHLTLTGKVENMDYRLALKEELKRRFEPALEQAFQMDSLSIFVQHGDQPFYEYRKYYFESPVNKAIPGT